MKKKIRQEMNKTLMLIIKKWVLRYLKIIAVKQDLS